MAASMLAEWIKNQKLRGPAAKGATTFHRNLEEALNVRRRDHALYTLNKIERASLILTHREM